MTARVVLLILAVGAFVAIWSADRRRDRGQEASARIAVAKSAPAQRADRSDRRNASSRPRPMIARRERRRSTVTTSVGTAASRFTSAANIPLPGGITPGEFRIVRSDGRVQQLWLSAEELHRRGLDQSDPPRECYVLHDGRVRWYFIRIAAGVTGFADNAPAAAPRRPAVARKPRPVGDVLREWTTEVQSLMLRPLHVAHSAARPAVFWSIAELRLRWCAAVADAAEQWARAATRARQVAAESGASRR